MRRPSPAPALACLLAIALGVYAEDPAGIEQKDPAGTEQIMADLDKNKDGFLTLDEFLPYTVDVSDEDLEHVGKVLKSIDTDGDGKISKEEVPAMMTELYKEYAARQAKEL
mmetsp:Transcript_56928/g.152438  ORF Transcript_56928/g.152438 Transcript_56928/m.152438 type:complete len:111 (-) Transcript_56928:52-384(-)